MDRISPYFRVAEKTERDGLTAVTLVSTDDPESRFDITFDDDDADRFVVGELYKMNFVAAPEMRI
jgi:hypothetical protein